MALVHVTNLPQVSDAAEQVLEDMSDTEELVAQ
jgi:hypothetical protein